MFSTLYAISYERLKDLNVKCNIAQFIFRAFLSLITVVYIGIFGRFSFVSFFPFKLYEVVLVMCNA